MIHPLCPLEVQTPVHATCTHVWFTIPAEGSAFSQIFLRFFNHLFLSRLRSSIHILSGELKFLPW